MSVALKMGKKKYSQQELRRIMNETKAAKQHQLDSSVKRIESPLAKYNDLGQLTCVLCRSIVRSETVWKVHVNSRQHKENIEEARRPKDSPNHASSSMIDCPSSTKDTVFSPKRPGSSVSVEDSIATKKPKGILKNAQSGAGSLQTGTLPNDVCDSDDQILGHGKASSIRKDIVNIRLPEKHKGQRAETVEENQAEKDIRTIAPSDEEKLPEGFFDDPKMDAKARNQEYKDPNDEEWDKFQKEIKEATNISMAIISEEQEESTAERQIAEIDEQIRNWSRVLNLEKKKEQMQTVKGKSCSSRSHAKNGDTSNSWSKFETEDDDEDDDEFDEFLDWRAKKSYK